MDKYLVRSTKWSDINGCATWWGPNSSGYTSSIRQAGIYTEEQAKRLEANHGANICIAVEFDEELFKKGLKQIQGEIQFHEKEKEQYKEYVVRSKRRIAEKQEILENYIETMAIK